MDGCINGMMGGWTDGGIAGLISELMVLTNGKNVQCEVRSIGCYL